MKKNAIVIGAGFSGLSAACYLARDGYAVRVLEKNDLPGGRARKFAKDGFTFDMGPSWYWMPDVFDRFFGNFGKKTCDFYQLERLDPSYRIVWGTRDQTDLPADFNSFLRMFESMEPGSADKLKAFLNEAEFKYKVGINKLVYKKSASPFEFIDPELMIGVFKLHVFKSFHNYIRKYFTNSKLIQMLEFPVLFLGGTPKTTPALYSLMNYADIKLGTWYPKGGMYKVVEGMVELARSLGVEFEFGAPVDKLRINNNSVEEVILNSHAYSTDVVVASADYRHVEHDLLPDRSRQYSDKYWDKRVMSPSSLIFYLGINKKLPNLKHHTLFFDEDFSRHADEIYNDPKWPERPSIYLSNTSKTDNSVAPEGMENIMVLIPVAPGLDDSDEVREKYFDYVIEKLEKYTGENIRDHIIVKRSYAHRDFVDDYNAFKGNAYGLANTLMQTAFLKPKLQSDRVKNLFYAGQLTVPGPGVPPAIISGEVAAREIVKQFKN
ncbi:MAG: phytoene desaturase family protein [Bacteroidales bacterium]